jgi:hypothetical protein
MYKPRALNVRTSFQAASAPAPQEATDEPLPPTVPKANARKPLSAAVVNKIMRLWH